MELHWTISKVSKELKQFTLVIVRDDVWWGKAEVVVDPQIECLYVSEERKALRQ